MQRIAVNEEPAHAQHKLYHFHEIKIDMAVLNLSRMISWIVVFVFHDYVCLSLGGFDASSHLYQCCCWHLSEIRMHMKHQSLGVDLLNLITIKLKDISSSI